MARKLLRHSLTIATALTFTAAGLFGLGLWRRSGDVKWCRQAAAGGAVADGQPLESDLIERIRSACANQRDRQRVLFGSIWRTGGRDAAACGFELARLQLISFEEPNSYRAVLAEYGAYDPGFEISTRENQDRFLQACHANRQHKRR